MNERREIDELIKSLTRFSWALSLFGINQIANALVSGRVTDGLAALTCVVEDQLDDVLKLAFRAGDQLQRGTVDVMYNVMTLEAFTPRQMTKITFDLIERSAETISLFVPSRESRLALHEFKNRLQAFGLFEHVDSALQLQRHGDVSLQELIQKAEALDPYAAVWATEGLGHYFVETCWEQGDVPRNLLKDGPDGLSARGLAALHAGMGLAIANRLLKRIKPRTSKAEIRNLLDEFVALSQNNSSPGYAGAAYESLGLATRNLYPQLITTLDQQMSETHEYLSGYFWHGVGRAIYFAPTNSLPGVNAKRQALDITQQEPPNELGRRNALAGLVWAITLVNIRQPEILETFLLQHGDQLKDKDAFVNGVASAIMIWRDSTGGDRYLDAFCEYQPVSAEAGLLQSWELMVRQPCIEALQKLYPVLNERDSLWEVFQYLDLSVLVQRLQNDRRTQESFPE